MNGKFVCVTPFDECNGAEIGFDAKSKGLRARKVKSHNSGEEANRCYGRYLVRQGYTQVNSREYAKAGFPTETLPKAGRRPNLRNGKSWKGSGRVMPAHRTSGTIVG